jgi:hypothetical protein
MKIIELHREQENMTFLPPYFGVILYRSPLLLRSSNGQESGFDSRSEHFIHVRSKNQSY